MNTECNQCGRSDLVEGTQRGGFCSEYCERQSRLGEPAMNDMPRQTWAEAKDSVAWDDDDAGKPEKTKSDEGNYGGGNEYFQMGSDEEFKGPEDKELGGKVYDDEREEPGDATELDFDPGEGAPSDKPNQVKPPKGHKEVTKGLPKEKSEPGASVEGDDLGECKRCRGWGLVEGLVCECARKRRPEIVPEPLSNKRIDEAIGSLVEWGQEDDRGGDGYPNEQSRYIAAFQQSGREDPEQCPCHGSGWMLSELDTWESCPYHDGEHPEEYEARMASEEWEKDNPEEAARLKAKFKAEDEERARRAAEPDDPNDIPF